MNIEKIMQKSVVTIGMDVSLQEVKRIFDENTFHHLLVVESAKLIGVLAEGDLLKALSPNIGTPAETNRDASTLSKKAHQIMTRNPVSLLPDAGIYDAIEIFNNHNISCIPVVNDKNKPVGIISWRDILKAIARK